MNFRVLTLALGTFALGTDVFVIAGILPGIAHSFDVSMTVAGQLVTVFAVMYAVSSPILAGWTARVDRRRVLIGAMAVFVAGNLLAAVSASYGELLAARILAASGAALFTPTASATAAGLVDAQRRGRALAFVLGGMTFATVLGVPVGTWVGVRFGWQATFGLVATLGALSGAGLLMFLPRTLASGASGRPADRFALLRRPEVVGALVLTTAWTIGGFSIYTYIAPLLRQITHLGATGLGAMLLLYGVAALLGNLLGGLGADRWSPVRTIAASLAVVAVTLSTLPLIASTVPGAVVSLVAWGMAGWALQAPQQHRLITYAPEPSGLVLSLNGSAIYIGIALGAALGGVTMRYLGVALLGPVGAAWEVFALALLVLAVRREYSQAQSDAAAGSGADVW